MAGIAHAHIAIWQQPANPGFLIIGPARSATAWLHRRLTLHPDIYLPRIKEIHFFDAVSSGGEYVFDLHNRAHWRWYWSYFQRAGDRISGDVTPAYSSLPEERVSEIVGYLPEARFIYSIRNPVERAWSGLRHRIWYGTGKHADELDTDVLAELVLNQQILDKGDHRANIEKWEACGVKERLAYIFYDDIIAEPRSVLDTIVSFIGLNPAKLPDQAADSNKVNALDDSGMPDKVREILNKYYRDQIPYLESKFERSLSSWGI